MIYRVIILPRAKSQLYESALCWAQNRSTDQALRWLDGFEAAIATLETGPERCGLARENAAFPFAVRQLLYGLGNKPSHRAIFEIRGEEVIIFSIRHLAQQDLTPDEF